MVKIKVPQKIKIATHEYRVEFNPLIRHEENLTGSANHLRQRIQVDPLIAPSQKLVTLLHEVNHVISDVYSCKLGEDEIDKMAQGFAELLADNFNLQFDWSDIKELSL